VAFTGIGAATTRATTGVAIGGRGSGDAAARVEAGWAGAVVPVSGAVPDPPVHPVIASAVTETTAMSGRKGMGANRFR
jgi:hypothetical protein